MDAKFGPAADVDWPVLRWYLLAIVLVFLLILGRLFFLQVIAGSRLRLSSLDNVIQSVEIPPGRGTIFDRAGRALAEDTNVYALLYKPPPDIEQYFPTAEERQLLEEEGRLHHYLHRETGQSLRELIRLGAYLNIPYGELMRRVEAERKRVFGFQPVALVDELSQEQVVYLGEHRQEFDGLFIERFGFKRTYHLGEHAGHLVGYTGLVTAEDPQSIRNLPYGPRETVGKEGVERCYEQMLHGAAGSRDIEIDRQRVFQDVIREVPPRKGTDIYLTIDKEIQARAQQLLGGRPGAVIVSCLSGKHAGEILALASSPTYDPNRFKERGYYSSLLEDPNLPLLNRAYRHAFQPGSTFKLVTVTAALQTGALTAGAGFTCNGYLELGRNNKRFYCHNRTGHGSLTLVQAIAESCDVAFYTIALRLEDPPQTIKRYGERFGYGSPVGIDLPGEVGGILPDAQWKREHYAGERYFEVDRAWYDGDTVNYGIGQGFLTATPLQVLWSAQVVALKGEWVSPRLLYAKVADRQIVPVPADEPRLLQLSPQVLETVAEGMRQAVISGTCKKLNLAQMNVCAKSGTAETGIAGEDDHAWVTGYWPRQNPCFGFVVFFQNGGSAGDTAVPAARELLLFMRDYDPLRRLADSGAEE